jgi:RNA polymerase sigma factor for flagellar operon FliA
MDETTIRVDGETRDLVLLRHLPLVRSIARVIALSMPSVNMEDLVGYGIVGLISAAMRHDPRRGPGFETYATRVVRDAILDAFRDFGALSPYYRRRARVVSETAAGLASELGRAPTDEELAERLGLSIEGYRELVCKIEPAVHVPLESFLQFGDAILVLTVPVLRGPRSLLSADRRQLRTLLLEAVGKLSKRETSVIRLRYTDGTSQDSTPGRLIAARVGAAGD